MYPKLIFSTFLFLWCLCSHTNSYAQADYYVNASTTCTTGCNGTTWAKAFDNLQSALDVAIEGEDIWVAKGTYTPSKDVTGDENPSNNRDKTFYLDKDLKIYGGFPNSGTPTMGDRDWRVYKTILSGDFNGDDMPIANDGDIFFNTKNRGENAYTVVHTEAVSNDFLVDGVCIEDGNSNDFFSTTHPYRRFGGGWYNNGSGTDNSSNPTIQNCSFEANSTANSGGGFYNNGEGGESSPMMSNCVFQKNISGGNGGGLYNNGTKGGESSPHLINCIFQDNDAMNNGGGLCNNGEEGRSSPILLNCSFYKNNGDDGGAISSRGFNGVSSPIITNCIFWQNQASTHNIAANPQISYSLLQDFACPNGSTCGEGMIYAKDPLFEDAENGDFSLVYGSPAIDKGTSIDAPNTDFEGEIRPQGEGIDMGIDEFSCTSSHIVYVKPKASGLNDGSSWAGAFIDLQDAIDLARECPDITEIWVAQGVYLPTRDSNGNSTPSNNRRKTFYFDFDVKLYGGFPNVGNPTMEDRDWVTHKTTLNGDFYSDDVPITDKDDKDFPAENNGENAFNVVHTKNVNDDFVMDGFWIEGGKTTGSGSGWFNDVSGVDNCSNPIIQNCTFQYNESDSKGTLYNDKNTSPNLIACTFQYNKATEGGAMYIQESCDGSTTILTDCIFQNNKGGTGGAVININSTGNSSLTVNNCSFINNQSSHDGGAWYNSSSNNNESSPILTHCSFINNESDLRGGAWYNTSYANGKSSPSFNHCSFQNNKARAGGALYNFSSGNGKSSPILTNCSFQNNESNEGGAWYNSSSSDGESSPTVNNCSFQNNQSKELGGAWYNSSFSDSKSSPTVNNCSFQNNQSKELGGAWYNSSFSDSKSSPTLTDCSFQNNESNQGGAWYNNSSSDGESSPILINCSFQNNIGTLGRTWFNNSFQAINSPTFTNCTFYDEVSAFIGRTIYNNITDSESYTTVTNCIFWGNENSIDTDDATVQISYSILPETQCPTGVTCGEGMIYAQDPLFLDAENGDLNLKSCSPAINVGDGNATISINETGSDLADNARFFNGGVVDLGAYEYQNEPHSPSPNIIGSLEYCVSNNSTTLDAGNWTNYKWSNGEKTQVIAVSEGTYAVTVSNEDGCIGTAQVSVTENESPIPIIRGILKYCASDNFTTLDAGGWTSYQWSNGETSRIIEASAGTYTVTVTNSSDCTGTDEVTVIENENPVPTITGVFEYCRGRQARLGVGSMGIL